MGKKIIEYRIVSGTNINDFDGAEYQRSAFIRAECMKIGPKDFTYEEMALEADKKYPPVI